MCLGLCFLFLSVSQIFADQTPIEDVVRQLQKRIEILEQKLSQQDAYIASQKNESSAQQAKISDYELRLSQLDEKITRKEISPVELAKGLDISVGITAIAQGTSNVNNATSGVEKKSDRTDASYSTDIILIKEFQDANSRAFVHLEAGKGDGLNDDLTLYSNVNNDPDNNEDAHLTEAWYEQMLLNGKLALTVGKLDPTAYFDNNQAANDETAQFLSGMFVNNPVVEFPGNSAAIRVAYMPKDWVELGYEVLDANSDWEKLGDNLFNMGEINFKPKLFNLDGNYRFYAWNNNAYHTKWTDTDKTKENSYGAGLSFDQRLNDMATVFTRYGWQYPKVYNPDTLATGNINYSLGQSWSAGLQLEGKPWGRDNDVLGIAVGQIFPSVKYKKRNNYLAKPEGHFETYYKIFLNKYLSVSPDLQYIWNPFGKDVSGDTAGIFIGGVRAQVDF
jgi:carbohydrate-selective porin OprB